MDYVSQIGTNDTANGIGIGIGIVNVYGTIKHVEPMRLSRKQISSRPY